MTLIITIPAFSITYGATLNESNLGNININHLGDSYPYFNNNPLGRNFAPNLRDVNINPLGISYLYFYNTPLGSLFRIESTYESFNSGFAQHAIIMCKLGDEVKQPALPEEKSLGLGSGSVPTGIIPGEIPNRIPTEDSLSRSNSLFGVDQERMYHPARGMSSTEQEKSNDTKYEVDFNKEVQVCKDKWDCMPRWESV